MPCYPNAKFLGSFEIRDPPQGSKAVLRFQASRKNQHVSLPMMALIDLHPELARRRCSHATLAAYLLALARAQLRLLLTVTATHPYLIAICYKTRLTRPMTPVYVIYTATISHTYLECICARRNVDIDKCGPVTVFYSPDHDATDLKEMTDAPGAVWAVQDTEGEEAAVARNEETTRVRKREFIELQQERRRRLREWQEEEEDKKHRQKEADKKWRQEKRRRLNTRKRTPQLESRKKVKDSVDGDGGAACVHIT
ncbi:hypothetical protein FN846DRAFT_992230 [Sphaerosporella brunnea]|uniref:Uncharacterized protein n=1 Tax=Sphaerosporella brunnea TaxID=1250544 RepID=A0A5J5ECJ6_9PEZI|nr:hypothetical protein FN846DRAFT_914288 [Sphaerosporella brunnea]KAA8897770.1 hypothetical protein FN846DRAFT_992230 [Sphaerosporella brunnea]